MNNDYDAFYYVANNLDLKNLLERLNQAKVIALDTEFTRRSTYYPVLSLVQIAINHNGKKEVFIIDCLRKLDLSGFYQIIANPKIVKIFHSAMQDLQILHHQSKLLPQSVLDTQIMGNLCGYGFNLGYSKLVEELFNVQLDKKQQDSDWQRRPLSSKQLEYAKLDVIFLEEIYNIFLEKIGQYGRIHWLEEEMADFINNVLFRKDDALFKGFSFKNKNPVDIFQIKNLILWREKWAQKIDIPRRHFLSDEEIEKMVEEKFCDLNFDPDMMAEVDAILNSKDKDIEIKEKSFFMNEEQKMLYQKVKDFISKLAARENLQEQVLLGSFDIKTIACRKNLFDKLIFGWRYELFGEELKRIINL